MLLTACPFLAFAAHPMQHASPCLKELYWARSLLAAGHQLCSERAQPPIWAAQQGSAAEQGFRWDHLPKRSPGFTQRTVPSHGFMYGGHTEQRRLAGEQSPEMWGAEGEGWRLPGLG